jgi:LPS export ABC transporter protein LptC
MKNGLLDAVLTSAIVMTLLSTSCRNDPPVKLPFENIEKMPSQTIYDAEIMFTDSGKLSGKLKAVKLDHYEGKRSFTVMPRGVKVWFYNDTLKPETFMTANYAMKFDDKEIIDAHGNVEVVNNKGEKLNTEHLIWDRRADRISSDRFVKITTADEILMGDGLESNGDFTRYKILKIRGTLRIRE